VLVFHEPYKRGNFIRVIAGDNYLEGYISEINLFNTKLITEEKEVIVYPNIQLMSNPALINPRTRYKVIGKYPRLRQKAKAESLLSKSSIFTLIFYDVIGFANI